ncbi:hypothetical protein J4456_02675 [Candidatus Pacearchaeota archaeon]|nr:hypothetical protein [Candidatus Pacearchaeota archaeon]
MSYTNKLSGITLSGYSTFFKQIDQRSIDEPVLYNLSTLERDLAETSFFKQDCEKIMYFLRGLKKIVGPCDKKDEAIMIQSYYCDLSAYIEGERPVEINIHLDFMKNPDKVITNPITIRTKDLGLSARILEDSHPRYTEYTAIEDNKREMLRQRILVAGSHVVHLITEFVPLNIHFIDHILGHTEKSCDVLEYLHDRLQEYYQEEISELMNKLCHGE